MGMPGHHWRRSGAAASYPLSLRQQRPPECQPRIQFKRVAHHKLPVRHRWQHVINKVRGAVSHRPRAARWAHAPSLAAERHNVVMPAEAAMHADETMFRNATATSAGALCAPLLAGAAHATRRCSVDRCSAGADASAGPVGVAAPLLAWVLRRTPTVIVTGPAGLSLSRPGSGERGVAKPEVRPPGSAAPDDPPAFDRNAV